MSPEQHSTTAVFVDQSGRRRRLVMVVGIVSSVLAIGVLAVVIGGAFSRTTLSVSGWPGDQPEGVAASPHRSPTPRTSSTRRPTPSPVQARPTPTPTRTATPSRRPTPKQSATRRPTPRQEPTERPEPSEEPTAEPAPTPGETTADPTPTRRIPPGLDPDRTKGPKK
ncbi:hypothetical protein [Nonomuraea roseoviolacea]|uniref:Uncharacterized protein n=1 Tax=Nonomuraea roseoviolacea subsp. carminata TaxID=160689 RepID=A0ABT1K3N7_9ACTN|nr:hypothetical protein [Nonomuraea roseoviolacea]MCP2348232.1 hypothetical protein [Nonomuraea roseoviolacea subsp. carminata]